MDGIFLMVFLMICFWSLLISDKILKIKEKEISGKRGMLLILRDTILLLMATLAIVVYVRWVS